MASTGGDGIEGDIVVDLGASLGPFTYKILPKNPKQCYVVEPLSYHIDVLYKNVGRDNVKIIQGAITDKKKLILLGMILVRAFQHLHSKSS